MGLSMQEAAALAGRKGGKLMRRNALTDSKKPAAVDDKTIQLTEPVAEALRPVVLETPVILDLKS
jgi:hypothetical protein